MRIEQRDPIVLGKFDHVVSSEFRFDIRLNGSLPAFTHNPVEAFFGSIREFVDVSNIV
ncbi:hypothetical protein [Natronococcus wangiae]|uniref:hypothetical protein n=1 Tax=Natronococcus wangiae TaxID=3068275 RepID=UPI00273D15D8|nr:hypothetical protein [Natronococcus sp. AD5]